MSAERRFCKPYDHYAFHFIFNLNNKNLTFNENQTEFLTLNTSSKNPIQIIFQIINFLALDFMYITKK